MNTLAWPVLVVIAMVAFANYRNGTLGDWLKAKFFNAAAPRPSGAGATAPSSGPDGVVLSGLGGGLGTMRTPVSGPVTGRFGEDRGDHRHGGVDFGVPVGTPVHAARAGRVTYAGAAGTYGLRVDLDHGGGVTTRYAHLSTIKVGLGQSVPAGAVIALSGNTGRSTGPHLHFEVRVGGVARDPSPLLGAGAVLSA